MKVNKFVGSGGKIWRFTLPFLIIGVALNILVPRLFSVGGPGIILKVLSILVLIAGVTIWIWSTVLILTKIPRKELITSGPYSLVRHPIYTSVSLLVIPWFGFLLNTWLGAFVGMILYIASRRYAPEEEEDLSKTFGPAWGEYCKRVKIPWL